MMPLPAGEASKEPTAPVAGTVSTLLSALMDLPPWPGKPEGTRAIVTRRVAESQTQETLWVAGYLRIGVEGQQPDRLYDEVGNPLSLAVQQGDFIDGFEHYLKWLSRGATIQRPVPADGAGRSS